MAIMKKGMGKPMKKAQNGAVTKKKPAKTYPILSEEGDLADALNETARMRAAGKAPKTSATGMKVMDKFQKEGKLGPAVPKTPKKKMGGKVVKKAKSGGKFPDLNKDGKVTKADILKGRGVIAKKGASVKKAQMGSTMTAAPIMKKGGSMKKCKYGCK